MHGKWNRGHHNEIEDMVSEIEDIHNEIEDMVSEIEDTVMRQRTFTMR